MDYAEVVKWLKQEHGLDFSVVEIYEGLNEGAALLESKEGKSLVLKTWRHRSGTWAHQARQAVERAREGLAVTVVVAARRNTRRASVLSPRTRTGMQVSTIDDGLAEAIVRMNRLQDGCAFRGSEVVDYNTRVTTLLLDDFEGWKEQMRTHSEVAQRLVDALLERVQDPHALAGDDLVHGDYSRTNLFALNHSIAALVDVDNIGWGNRALDLIDAYRQMVLLKDPPGARHIIRQEAEEVATVEGFYTGFAFWTIANLAWAINVMPQHVPERIAKLQTFVESKEY